MNFDTNKAVKVKRAIFVLAGIIFAALVATIPAAVTAAWSINEQNKLATQAKFIGEAAERNSNSLLTLGTTEQEVITNFNDLVAFLSHKYISRFGIKRAERLIASLEKRMQFAELALQSGINGRFPVQLLMHLDHKTLVADIWRQAAKQNLRPVFRHTSDLLQLETTWSATEHGVNLLLHVPLVDEEHSMIIYRHHPLPVPLGYGLHLNVQAHDHEYLAIHPDNTIFRALSQSDFQDCRSIGTFKLCDFGGVSKKAPLDTTIIHDDHEMCLYSLFTRRHSLARRTCSTTVSADSDRAVMLSPNKFAVYTNNPQHAAIKCSNRQQTPYDQQLLHGVTTLELPPDCTASTDQFLLSTADSSFDRPDRIFSLNIEWPVDPLEWTNGTSPQELKEIITNMKDAGAKVQQVPLDALVSARLAHKANVLGISTARQSNVALWTIGILTTIVIVSLAYWFAIKCKINKKTNNNLKDDSPSAPGIILNTFNPPAYPKTPGY